MSAYGNYDAIGASLLSHPANASSHKVLLSDVLDYNMANFQRKLTNIIKKTEKKTKRLEELKEAIKEKEDQLKELRKIIQNEKKMHHLEERECVFCGIQVYPEDALRCRHCFDVNFFDQNVFIASEKINKCSVCWKEDITGIVWATCRKHSVCLECLDGMEKRYKENKYRYKYLVRCPVCRQ